MYKHVLVYVHTHTNTASTFDVFDHVLPGGKKSNIADVGTVDA